MEVLEETKITLSSYLDWAQRRLAEVASPRLDAEVLMAQSLDISRTELMTYPERILNRVEAEIFVRKSREGFYANRFLTLPECRNSGRSNLQ